VIACSLSDAAKTLVQVFTSCRLDYRNALLFGISSGLIQSLPAGHFLIIFQIFVTTVTEIGLRQILHKQIKLPGGHWSSSERAHHAGTEAASLAACSEAAIDFKVVVLVYNSLHGFTPPYLSDDCQLVTQVGRRHLRIPVSGCPHLHSPSDRDKAKP